jgi:predicted Zn-dependent peptidase
MDGPQAANPFTQEGEEQIQQEQAQAERERTQPQQKKQSKAGSGGKQKGQQKPAPPKVDKEKMERAQAQLEREWLDQLSTVGSRADQFCRFAVLFGDPRLALTAARIVSVAPDFHDKLSRHHRGPTRLAFCSAAS